MTTEAAIHDYKLEGPPSPLWITASVDFRFSLIFLGKIKKNENGGIEKSHR